MITCTVTLWYHSAGMFVDKNVPFEELPIRYVYVCTLYVCVCLCVCLYVCRKQCASESHNYSPLF